MPGQVGRIPVHVASTIVAVALKFPTCLHDRIVVHVSVGSYSHPLSICGIWGSYYNVPKAILYLLKGDYIQKTSNNPETPALLAGWATSVAQASPVTSQYQHK